MTTTAESRTQPLSPREARWRMHDLVSLYDVTRETGLGLAGMCANISDQTADKDRVAYWDQRFDLVEDRVAQLDPKDRMGLLIQCDACNAAYSATQSKLLQRFAGARPVPVTGDDFRRFHPDYRQLMMTNQLAMPNATASLSGPLNARWTPPTAHDVSYAAMPDTLARLEADRRVSTISVPLGPMAFERLGYLQDRTVPAWRQLVADASRVAQTAGRTGEVLPGDVQVWTGELDAAAKRKNIPVPPVKAR